MIDYRELINSITEEKIEQILDKLSIPWIDKGDFLICKTACHNEDIENASWKLYYYKNSHNFYCYTECGSLSIFHFLEKYYETRGIQYDWFEDVLGFIQSYGNQFGENSLSKPLYKSERERYEPRKLRRELPSFPNGLLDTFVKRYPAEWIYDGISHKAMDKYNIRYSIPQNKIIIPHYDVNNNLIGIRGRALNSWEVENVGKYMPVQIEGKWYSHPLSLNLYGLNFNKENIKQYGICYIVEAEKSTLQAESFSFPNCCVSICGSQFNRYQLDLLLRYAQPREIVLCLDNEEKPGSEDYFRKLWKICDRYKVYCNFSFVYDRKNLTGKKDSPTDKGEEIFRELLKGRVKVY